MKKLILILGLTLGLTSPLKADTIWTLVDMLLLDDFRQNVDTTVFRDKEDCRSAALKQFIKITGYEKGIQVQENKLAEPLSIRAILVTGNGKFSGYNRIYYIACVPSNPIK